MNCGRASEIDVALFLTDATAEAQAAFREHYPDCADCSAAVARWSALDLAIRELPTNEGPALDAHPAPEVLELYVDDPASLGSEQVSVRGHVDRCGQCQTELALLRQFDAAPLAAAAAAGAAEAAEAAGEGVSSSAERVPSPAGESGSWLDPVRRFFESITPELGLSPAAVGGFAVALLALLGIWASGVLDSRGGDPEDQTGGTRIVERERPSPQGPESPPIEPGVPRPEAPLDQDGIDVERLAVEPSTPSESVLPAPVIPTPAAPDRPAPQQLAETPSAELPPEPPADAPSIDELGGEREVVLLASLDALPLPTYGSPAGAESLEWMWDFGTVRGTNEAAVDSRAPDHVGLTLSMSPRLWWTLDRATERTLQVTVVDDEAIEPVLRVNLPGPHPARLQSISLADHGIELQPGVEYRWFVSVLVDADRPSKNPTSGGAIRALDSSDERRQKVAGVATSERGHLLARLGLWYDAYDFFAALSVEHPEADVITRHREHLVEVARSAR